MKLAATLLCTLLLSGIVGCSDDGQVDKPLDGQAIVADPTRCRVQCHLYYRDLRSEVPETGRPPSETADIFIDYDFNKESEALAPQIVQLPKKVPMYHATIIKRDGEFVLELRNAQKDLMICETAFDIRAIRKRHPAGERDLSGLTYIPHPTVNGLELQFFCTLLPAE